MKDTDVAHDKLFEVRYAQSDLKQRYDTVVTDDACGIGGFLWKYPSEGSNCNSDRNASRHALVYPLANSSCDGIIGSTGRGVGTADGAPVYPRKCATCERAWVSDRSAERRHRRVCAGSGKRSKARSAACAEIQSNDSNDGAMQTNDSALPDACSDAVAKLGVARRVWCEVDSSLSRLQWREDIASEQDTASCVISFVDILEISTLRELPDAFQIVTSAPRTVVFQCRPRQEEDASATASAVDARHAHSMDAEHWCEYLDVFSQYARQQQQSSNQQHSPTVSRASAHPHAGRTDAAVAAAAASASDSTSFDPDSFARVTRAIIHDDVDALVAMVAANTYMMQHMTDDSGSSMLIVALKLGAGPRIIRLLLDAGVDCNAKNHDDESALLLVAASGDDDMLRVLLQVDTIDVNQTCSLGATAFHAAANAGDLHILEMLCAAGAQTSAIDANGWTALHYAAACPTGLDAMHWLCELLSEQIDCQCRDGNTALHVASGYGCVANVRALLETAANPHVTNREGHTAYHVALRSHKIPCAVAINEYMADSHDRYAAASVAAAAGPTKTDAVTMPSIAFTRPCHFDPLVPDTWVEYSTPDGLPYFYNTVTGASSWHEPVNSADLFGRTWGDRASSDEHDNSDAHNKASGDTEHDSGQQLALCLIPMVSLLASLDDPTAAAKIASARKRARAKRRAHVRRQVHDRVADSSQS